MPIYMGIFEKPNALDKKFKGAVKAKGYEGWIELESASLGIQRGAVGGTGRGRETSAPQIQEMVITRFMDSVSATLFMETVHGTTGKLIVIVFLRGDGDGARYPKIVLENALFSSYSNSSHEGRPTESYSLNSTKITYDYVP